MSDIALVEGINTLDVQLVPIEVTPPGTVRLYGTVTDAETGEVITRLVKITFYKYTPAKTIYKSSPSGIYSVSVPPDFYDSILFQVSGHRGVEYYNVALTSDTELNVSLQPL